MSPPLPSVLHPYLSAHSSAFAPGSLTLVTSVLDAPPTWLLPYFVLAALKPLQRESNEVTFANTRHQGDGRPVVFVSFLRSFSIWSEIGRKMGLDFASSITAQRLVYIDGLVLGPQNQGSLGKPGLDHLKSLDLKDVKSAIARALERFQEVKDSTAATPHRSPVIIIDGLDFLLALQSTDPSTPTSTSPTARSSPLPPAYHLLHTVLLPLLLPPSSQDHHRQYSNHGANANANASLILSCSADKPLLHPSSATTLSPLSQQHTTLLTTLAHTASLIFQLRPLDTGAARDVSGVLRISSGGGVGDFMDDEGEQEVFHETSQAQREEEKEGEWLYHVRGDGGVRVWGRGE